MGKEKRKLITPFEKDIKEIPFCDYPRPQMKRDSYLSLNGKWDFKIECKNKIKYSGEITVPFPPESRISGVERYVDKKDVLLYEKRFTLPENFLKDRLILNFGAVDQYTKVYVNDIFVGENKGGYIPFSFDITNALKQENIIKVLVLDPLDKALPYGKQSKKSSSMWYTKTSGIWQSVWLESVPEKYIKSLKITPTLNSVNIALDTEINDNKIIIHYPQGDKAYAFQKDIEIEIENPVCWSPENPYLYEFTVISGEDKIDSYFALRTVSIVSKNNKKYIALNGKPYYFHALLDQGYFSDGIFTPASAEGYKNDIVKMKGCGFNTLRKHIKIEPDLFYYYCDKYGMIVFQDMINSGGYSFLIDTAFPTVFFKKGITHFASKKRKEAFIETGEKMLELLYNHPCVCYYTIFNEGWGQFSTKRCYKRFKALDETRIFDTASGWFKTNSTDLYSEHVYFKKVNLKCKGDKPLVLSEFGGYSCKIPEHSFNLKRTYGYRFYNNCKDFENALIKLYKEEIKAGIEKGLCATVLTQVSDIEDETNGLLTYDRRLLKVDPKLMCEIKKELDQVFEKQFLV